MNLPFLNFFKKKEKPKYFLAFLLRHEKAIAVIFEQLGLQAKVVGSGEAYFEKNIEDAKFEEFLTVSDKAISKAEENVPDDSQALQTLFGLKESWIEEDKIKKEYLERLKKISDELGLTPIGFMTVTEAITNLLKKEEGAPLTAILAEIGKSYVTVSLIKAGKIMETKSSEIHESPAFTVDVLLKHFEIPEVLPSKIILYNGGDDDLSQKFIHHTWSKSLPFLHLPQIITLPEGFDAKSILQGAATKMGFDLISDTSLQSLGKEEIPALETIETKNADETEEKEEKKEKETEENEEHETLNLIEESDFVEKFGFFENEDVLKMPSSKKADEEILSGEKEKINDTFEENLEQKEHSEKKETKREIEYENLEEIKPKKKPINFLGYFGRARYFLSVIFKKLRLPKNKFIIIPTVLILFLVALYVYFFFTLKTTVVLTLNPKIDEKKQSVTFSGSTTDVDKKIIKGDFVKTSLDGTVSTSTTGKKETGDKAKGTVTFYSRFAGGKILASGTIITSTNSLDFSLDKSVEIGSASADASASPTTANGNVTAKNIGKESNLPSGAKFNVDSLDPGSIIAKNDDAFSGGTKKEIQVVAKADTEKLLTQVVKELESKAIESLTQKINDKENVLLPITVDSTADKKSFDKEVGDEATKLTLKATVTYEGLSYSKQDLISFTKSLVKKELSSKLEIDENNIKVAVENVKKKDTGEVSATLKIKAPLLPNLNKESIVKNISGKSNDEVKKTLLDISQVVNVDIKPSFPIPFLTNSLPRFSNNIEIVTKVNE
jgi:hypothetical protein